MHIFKEKVGILLKSIFIHNLGQTLFLFGCLCVIMPQIFSLVTFEKKERKKTLYRLSKVLNTYYNFWNLDQFCIILHWCIFSFVGPPGLLCVKWLIWITKALRKNWYIFKNLLKSISIYRKSIFRNKTNSKPSQKKKYQKYGEIPTFHVKITIFCVILGDFWMCDVTYFENIFITKRNIENPPHEGFRNVLFFKFLKSVYL